MDLAKSVFGFGRHFGDARSAPLMHKRSQAASAEAALAST
jgi:hypothetical protein